MIDKKQIIQKLLEKLNSEHKEMENVIKPMKDLVTSDALKSEGKYDTRAVEASYLVGAQLKRFEEIKIDMQMLEEIYLAFSEKVQLGTLALLEHNNIERYYFFSSTVGGAMLTINDVTILNISVFSPLGNSALGLSAGESFEVETPRDVRSYRIISLY
jgi:transcription elongation GreA/GreB family factor